VLPTLPEPVKCCVLVGTSAVLFALLVLVSGCTGSTSQSSPASATPTPSAVSVGVSPTAATVQAGGGTQSFSATVQNDAQNKGVTWALSGTGCSGTACGTLSAASSASGGAIAYTPPASVPNPASVTLTATSVTDGAKSAAAAITVSAAPPSPLAVTVSPTTATVQAGVGTQSFSATVQNDAQNKGVTWALSGAGCSGATCGALSAASSASGVAITYTAPASIPSPALVTLTGTSVADGTKSATAVITVAAASGNISVTLSPKRGGLTISQSLNFTATVANDSSGVTWSSTGGGSFSSQTTTTAVYVAPAVAGVIAVTATSNADVTKSASATIGVTGLAGVTTYRYDLSRDGVNANEYALTTSNVTTATFGKLFACPVDGSLFAQPLWVANLPIGGGTHNVIFAASSHDTVYAFDADASPCVTYWSKSLLGTGETWLNGPSDTGIDEIYPDVGIVGTPVIDPATKILYVVAKSKTTGSSTTYHQRIHALSLLDGSEQASGPVDLTSTLITIAGSGQGGNGTTVSFDPLRQNQRPGLALVNGNVYVGWGSHGDLFMWHGWLVGFNKSNLASAPIIYNTTRNGRQGSIWMAGGAPAADSNNNLYVITGNGDWDGVTDFGDSFLNLSTSGGLSLVDWFTPWNQATLDAADSDVGSGGAVVLVDLPATSPVQHLLVGGGKGDDGNSGKLYVLNRDSLGHSHTSDDNQIVQEFSFGQSIYGTPAFWQNTLYFAGGNGPLNAFALNPATSKFNTTAASKSATAFGYPSSSPAVSATGASNGIVWSLDIGGFVNASKSGQPTVVHAFDATDLSKELWNSGMVSADNPAGVAVKFTVPTVANGKVYVGSSQEVDVYGLKPN
jgi:hypothetical protein